MAYICNVCDKEFEHAGGRNLHQRWCRLLQLEKETKSAPIERKKNASQETKCNHEWNLLGNTQAEMLARHNGYTKYCSKCEEIE